MTKKDPRPKPSTHSIDDSMVHVSLNLDELDEAPSETSESKVLLVENLLEAALIPEDKRLGIKKQIAKGGVAAIWLTQDCALSRKVALKLMHNEACYDPILVSGFFREAQVTAQLSHPNVVPVHEMGISNGRPFFTMNLARGMSLNTWLKDCSPGDYTRLGDFLEIMKKVIDALEYAHSRSVLHCDLKPANIMVGTFGEVYLMDWGGAQIIPQNAEEGEDTDPVIDRLPPLPEQAVEGKIFGTPSYMAPEQAKGENPDQRWDIFAIGTIIYKFITGKSPFYAKDPMVSLALCQKGTYEKLNDDDYRNILPMELLHLVSKAMEKNPDDRYSSITALKKDLSNVIRGGTTFPVVEFPKGTEVIRQGASDKAAYIVQSGRLEAYQMEGDKKVSLRILKTGDVFGEMAMFASTARTASVVALSDVKLLRITEDVLKTELDTMTPWMATFVRTMAARFVKREILYNAVENEPVELPVPLTQEVNKDDSDIPPWYR